MVIVAPASPGSSGAPFAPRRQAPWTSNSDANFGRGACLGKAAQVLQIGSSILDRSCRMADSRGERAAGPLRCVYDVVPAPLEVVPTIAAAETGFDDDLPLVRVDAAKCFRNSESHLPLELPRCGRRRSARHDRQSRILDLLDRTGKDAVEQPRGLAWRVTRWRNRTGAAPCSCSQRRQEEEYAHAI